IQAQSHVLAPGVECPSGTDLSRAPAARPPGPPVILWNHRREYDKNPAEFFGVLRRLRARGSQFRLVLLGGGGGSRADRPDGQNFAHLVGDLADWVLHDGFAADRQQYWELLAGCSFQLVTAQHEF